MILLKVVNPKWSFDVRRPKFVLRKMLYVFTLQEKSKSIHLQCLSVLWQLLLVMEVRRIHWKADPRTRPFLQSSMVAVNLFCNFYCVSLLLNANYRKKYCNSEALTDNILKWTVKACRQFVNVICNSHATLYVILNELNDIFNSSSSLWQVFVINLSY